MVELPLVSIITPSYNQGEFLGQTIQSVLDQSYPRIEYLVIDGGSQDQSLEVIRSFSDRLDYWEFRPDRGQAEVINKGLLRAKGDILGWLNSDDILLPSSVSLVVNTLMNRPEIDVVYGRLDRIDEDGKLVPTPVLPKDRVTFDAAHAIGESVVNQPGCLWRRRIMEQVGLLDKSLRYVMDYEYWLRMLVAGAKFRRLDETLAAFRLSSRSKTVGQTALFAEEHLKFLDTLLERGDLAVRLGLSVEDVHRQVRRGQAIQQLYAFNGNLKQGRWKRAIYWLIRAMKSDPSVFFQERWRDLLQAKISRRFLKSPY